MCEFITIRLVAVRRLHTDEDVLVQQVLWVRDDGGELRGQKRQHTMVTYWNKSSSLKTPSLILPQLGCQTKLWLTRPSAPCSRPLKSWLFLWALRETFVLIISAYFRTTMRRSHMWRNILSKQLEWYSMKNLVFDFVNKMATQFMICIPPWGALFGSEEWNKRLVIWEQIPLSHLHRVRDGDHTLLGDKLWGYSDFKWSK